MVTIFKNLTEVGKPHYITVSAALQRIKSGNSKAQIELIRKKAFLGEDFTEEKKGLPLVLFSASKTKETLSKRNLKTHREDASVIEHSGYFILDFDKCDVELKKAQLQSDPYIYSTWTGPSGTGVKALVKCPANLEAHSLYYTAFIERHSDLDPTSRSLSRGTFESYDPSIWVNEQSLVWDKKLTEEQRRKNKEKDTGKRGAKIISTAVAMVRSSYDGTKHSALLGAANLLGGYIITGRVSEEEAIKVLEEEIRLKKPDDFEQARRTIREGIDFGKQRPLIESKKIEKAQQYLRREDGSYDFLADDQAMDEYLISLVNGTLEFGKPTGMNRLNAHFLFKKHTMTFIVGAAGVGKSFLLWYFSILASTLHRWKVIMHSAENNDGELRKKLMEFHLGKSVKVMDDEELTISRDFVKEHYRIISSSQMHSMDEFFLKCEILIDEGFEADLVIAEPWNSFEIPAAVDTYRHNIHILNVARVFKEQYCSIMFADHINTLSARAKDKDGFALAPTGADVEGGAMKRNKTDDMIVTHRLGNHSLRKYETQIHVEKIKSVESGGSRTDKDNPVIVDMNSDFCGYSCEGQDPIKEYWKKKQL